MAFQHVGVGVGHAIAVALYYKGTT
jgi:hypothetical protein